MFRIYVECFEKFKLQIIGRGQVQIAQLCYFLTVIGVNLGQIVLAFQISTFKAG